MTGLVLPRLRSRLRAPVRQFAFWSQPAAPPFTDFPLVSPVPSPVPIEGFVQGY